MQGLDEPNFAHGPKGRKVEHSRVDKWGLFHYNIIVVP